MNDEQRWREIKIIIISTRVHIYSHLLSIYMLGIAKGEYYLKVYEYSNETKHIYLFIYFQYNALNNH
jgi:hypothetical protein